MPLCVYDPKASARRGLDESGLFARAALNPLTCLNLQLATEEAVLIDPFVRPEVDCLYKLHSKISIKCSSETVNITDQHVAGRSVNRYLMT